MDHLLYGAAYYDEYMPCDRLDKDVEMMKKAGVNVVRIAESTWATCEPQEGEFDFSHVTRVLDAMEAAGISVIVGTPTYAVPPWLAKKYPQVLQTWEDRPNRYGPRQNMDITNPDYRRLAERVIRKLLEVAAPRRCVIGFQLDNETKHYGTATPAVQAQFVAYLRKKYNGDLDALNRDFGFDYWSNRVNSWEEFPDVRGTINGSLGAAFEQFQRGLVAEFLCWQRAIVDEYRRPDQFVTHNFDYAWRGHSYGLQPDADPRRSAPAVTLAGCDIYHPGQDKLTGIEIALGGDIARGIKGSNYLVLETQAQGFPDWTPYPGQLRLQAYSHLASGANGVEYWHWHSLHNACETYWKGVLSHDFGGNATYREVCTIGQEFADVGEKLLDLQKHNEVAILVSHEALTALKWFGIEASAADWHGQGGLDYNDVLRWLYDALFGLNVECDFLWPDAGESTMKRYKALIVPALYSAPQALLERLARYAENGGTLITTFKTAFTDENVKVWHDAQPHALTGTLGVAYDQFTFPQGVGLRGPLAAKGGTAAHYMELLRPTTAQTLVQYDHPAWGRYAAVTRNNCGAGHAYHLGTVTDAATLQQVLRAALHEAGVDLSEADAPLTVRKGQNRAGRTVRYYLNYSGQQKQAPYRGAAGADVLTGEAVKPGAALPVGAWDVRIIEEAVTQR